MDKRDRDSPGIPMHLPGIVARRRHAARISGVLEGCNSGARRDVGPFATVRNGLQAFRFLLGGAVLTMTLPTFIVIGAAKSGTTSLASYLRSHPDIHLSHHKEPHYFTREWERGLEWYESLFSDGGDADAVGEASTSYSMYPEHPEAPERMAALLPDVRLIYLIRHPVDRVRSQYAHNLDRALEARAIGEAIRRDHSYLDATRYDLQISRFEEHFDPEQMMVVVSERLRHDRTRMLAEILDHIGVDSTLELSNTDRELNTMVDKRLAPPIVNRARRAARALGVNRLLSRSTKAQLRRAVSRKMPEEAVTLSQEDRSWILAELEDDLARLRARLGSQVDTWGLGSEHAG